MKVLNFFGILLIASIVFGVVTCKDDKPDKPDFTADYPEAEKVAGKITIFAKFLVEPCYDVVLAGSYKLEEGTTDWIENPAELSKFVSAGVIDGKDWGAEGWWKVTIDVPASAAISEHSAILGAKPVQLEEDDFAAWAFQIGDESTVELKSGDVDIQPGYPGECNIYFLSNATAAFIFNGWKNGGDPCNVVKRDYTFNVTVPEGTPGDAKVYLVGDMNGWTVDATEMTKAGSGYTVSLNNVREGSSYKYVLNASWDFEELAEIGEEGCANAIANRVTGTSATINDDVKNWRGVTALRCGSYPDVSAEAGKIVIFAKFETELCGEVGLVGTNNGWSDNLDNLPRFIPARKIGDTDWGKDGWWEITVDLEGASFDYDGGGVLSAKPLQLTEDGKFNWDYQIGLHEDGDIEVLAGGVDVLQTNPGECNILFRSNKTAVFIFKAWKNDPCEPAASIPAGTGTFKVTITSEVEEGADIVFTGNFAEKAWGESDRVMTLSDGKYTWTGNYPENFECKVIKRIEGEADAWSNGANQKFDGENFEFSFSF